jgi:hypothetical protein
MLSSLELHSNDLERSGRKQATNGKGNPSTRDQGE